MAAPNAPRQARSHLSMHDEELLAGKNKGRRVQIVLACPTYFTDEDGLFIGSVEKVDKYAIRFRLDKDTSGAIWVMKQGIVSTQEVTT